MKLVPLLLLAVLLFGAKAVQAQPGSPNISVYHLVFKVPRGCRSITAYTEFSQPYQCDSADLPLFWRSLGGDSKFVDVGLSYEEWDLYLDSCKKSYLQQVILGDRPIRLYIKLDEEPDYCCYYILRSSMPQPYSGDGYGYAGELRPGTRMLLCFPASPKDVPKVSWSSIDPTSKTGATSVEDDGERDLRPFLRAVPPAYDDRTSARPYCAPEWRRRAKAGSAKGIRPQYLREEDGSTTLIPYAPKAAPKPKRRRD